MPQSTVVSAPTIEWPYRVQYPGPFTNRRTRENFRSVNDPQRLSTVNGQAQAGVGPNDVSSIGQAESGATAGDFFRNVDGVPCSFTSIGPRGFGWSFPWWACRFDATAIPGGVRVPEGGVVAVIDAYFRPTFAASPDVDMVGVWIGGALDASAAATYRANTPGGASPGLDTGGAGVLLRADGTGYDYVAWGIGGAVAERVPIIVPPLQWNCFRFVLVSGLSGSFASLSVTLNSATPATIVRSYGTAVLPVPFAANAAATGDPVFPALAFTGTSLNSTGWAYAFEGKWGRFLPGGEEVQGQ